MRNGGPTTIRAVNHGWRVEIQNGVAAPLSHLAAVLQKCRRVHLLCAAGRVRGGSPVSLRNPRFVLCITLCADRKLRFATDKSGPARRKTGVFNKIDDNPPGTFPFPQRPARYFQIIGEHGWGLRSGGAYFKEQGAGIRKNAEYRVDLPICSVVLNRAYYTLWY